MAAQPSSVAVAFSGWLNVTIPADGREARRFLVEPLGADVFVAGTYLESDCPSGAPAEADGQCLLHGLRHLRPLTRVQLSPMLTFAQLSAHAHAAPAFAPVSRAFKYGETFKGLSIFSPVLGNPNVSFMRELHDMHRLLALLQTHERERGAPYERVVWSRLEFRWLAPHPPLALLRPDVVWVPSGQNVNGVNDRHAVMRRDHADVYLGRWSLLLSERLLRTIDLPSATHVGPEQYLGLVLEAARVTAGFFPNVAHLVCCEGRGRCFADECYEKPSLRACYDPTPPPSATDGSGSNGAMRARPRKQRPHWGPPLADFSRPAPPTPADARGCFPMRGKYWSEMHDAVLHWRYLQCSSARYWPLPRPLAKRWGWPPRLMLVVSAGRRWVEPIGASGSLDRGYMTRHVMLDHSSRARPVLPPPFASAGGGGGGGGGGGEGQACPVLQTAPRAVSRVPLAGYCQGTDGEGDCARGSKGAWDTRRHRLGSLQACVHKCRTSCARCNLVSYSQLHHDCSWFHSCHEAWQARGMRPELLDETQLWLVDSGWDYLTARVRPVAPRLAAADNSSAASTAAHLDDPRTTRFRRDFPGTVKATIL